MNLTNSQEEYLKTIYLLDTTENQIRVTDIANKLNITKPSVNKAVRTLAELQLLNYQTYGEITLTQEGKEIAKSIIKRQDTLELFLTEVLDVEKTQAISEANSMKHALSPTTQAKLEDYVFKILDLSDLKCNYDVTSEKCKSCISRKVKNRK